MAIAINDPPQNNNNPRIFHDVEKPRNDNKWVNGDEPGILDCTRL